jgi:thiamine-phosphate pyrophosphorylase
MTLDCRLYLITPPALTDLDAFGRDLARALSGGDVAALQIRLKDVSDAAIAQAVAAIAPIARKHDVAVILNDRPDLAAASTATACMSARATCPSRPPAS